MAFLNEFDLDIRHIPGKENQIADTLSRNKVKNGYVKIEGKTKTIAAIGIPDDELETTRWIEMIAEAQREDERLQREREMIPDDLPEQDGLIRIGTTKGERIIMPEAVKWELIRRVHNFLLHFGTDKVSDFISNYFELQNLERVVCDVVASCEVCQATKYYTRPTLGVEYFDLPQQPGQVVSMDIFGPLPQTPRGNKYILVLMDQFSKLVRFYAMKNQKLETIMDCLQIDKHGEKEAYQPDDKVWVKVHRRSDANRRLTKKIHLVYKGPFVIQSEVRKNAYVVKDSDDNVIGTFNSRQLRPYRETKLKPTVRINMMEPEMEIKRIPQREVEKYITNLKNKKRETLTVEEPMASSTPKKQDRDRPEDPGSSDEKSEKFLKKRSIISEKGMRHITRLVKLISGKTTV